MEKWILAMLGIGALLIVRDMAKTVFAGRRDDGVRTEENRPQKEKIEQYAHSFQRLANTFYSMPFHEEHLTPGEIQGIFDKMQQGVCGHCMKQGVCWKNRYFVTYQQGCELLKALEDGEQERFMMLQQEWTNQCLNGSRFIESLREQFGQVRQNLMWNNRLIESRLAVAEELNEVAGLFKRLSEDLYDVACVPEELEEKVRKALRREQVILKRMTVLDNGRDQKKYFLTMRARSGQCVTLREVERKLSDICGCKMAAEREKRTIINGEYATVLFTEDTNFRVLYGAAGITKEAELVSGDNYTCTSGNGMFTMCLSDGMGSGLEASQESEAVVDLLEQFITSGFSGETAAKMINSALILQRGDGRFSTVDICSLNLYTGICNFLKAGAATTFIKRDNWVETVTSTSIAAGLVQQMDYDVATKKLYEGDYLVMVTDGVLDALPLNEEEETMKNIIMQIHKTTPKEFGRILLERVMSYCNYRAGDDMTVLVAGVWKK